MYTVGPDYAHAEARKSPALDGKVERDSEGKEIRYPVMLTAMEKLVARKVCVAFKVCLCLATLFYVHQGSLSRVTLVSFYHSKLYAVLTYSGQMDTPLCVM